MYPNEQLAKKKSKRKLERIKSFMIFFQISLFYLKRSKYNSIPQLSKNSYIFNLHICIQTFSSSKLYFYNCVCVLLKKQPQSNIRKKIVQISNNSKIVFYVQIFVSFPPYFVCVHH